MIRREESKDSKFANRVNLRHYFIIIIVTYCLSVADGGAYKLPSDKRIKRISHESITTLLAMQVKPLFSRFFLLATLPCMHSFNFLRSVWLPE